MSGLTEKFWGEIKDCEGIKGLMPRSHDNMTMYFPKGNPDSVHLAQALHMHFQACGAPSLHLVQS